MKLDELEAKLNKIDTMPVPSPIGSTLRATLDKPCMVQVAAKAVAKAKAAALLLNNYKAAANSMRLRLRMPARARHED